ncbi:MAG: hypothetical protein XD64_0757 [Thermotoga sp. 47_83]|uniref:Uncharacterized protein n=1 Tax=Thermotoga petrophila TaxID=93929 RepID=A0A117L2Q8_9THEM|nr:hypothetical protein AS158_08095 [Thermotoga sp. 38H-to]KUK22913.1 MAG: hypothetical protein XD57_0989 [Thermotoga petrophila]KUK33416.1 MAG: hypothetical protein XD64_0757 [Thermotoga sp. 47_83]MDK2893466.1 hypothetical protein [Thermotoga sp.]MDK2898645.1 hypothetical protein [Thermotoga sp.]
MIFHEGVSDGFDDSCGDVVFFDMAVCAVFFYCRDSSIFTGGLGTGCHRNIQCNGTWKSSGSMRREYCE